ncbi:MAG: methionyl-tRNA formyltransferase [Bacteroidales bacterium]|nr:methionyl-tRNA formyltransferase [Bacteroidales bacterium]
MKRLDKFILKSFLGPFFLILAVVVFVLAVQLLWVYIDDLVGKGLGLRVILEFMFWGACSILPTSLPLATLLASTMTLGQMGENNELMAIRSAGVSVARVMVPIMVASVFISVAAYFVGNNLVPKAYNEIFTLRDDISRTKQEIKIPSGVFYDGIEGYILRVESQDKQTGMMHNVLVYDHSGNKGNTSIMMADSALMKMSKGKDYLTFTMFDGSSYQEDNNMSYNDTTLQLQRVDFHRQELIIQLAHYAFERSDSTRFGDQAKSQTFAQLVGAHDSLFAIINEETQKEAEYLHHAFQLTQRNQLDTALHCNLTELFRAEGFGEYANLDEKAQAYRQAADHSRQYVATVSSFGQRVYEQYYYVRRVDVELWKKFAQALACFILFFVGAPLGVLIKKGGLGISAIISVLFFVLYWVVDISGNKLARDGASSAWFGAFIACVVLLAIGLVLTRRAMLDAEFVNMDSIKIWWRRIKSRIRAIFHKPRIVYMGTPEFAVMPLDWLIKRKYKVVGVVTVADKPSGRGLKVNESAVKQYAVQHDIPVLQPLKLRDPEFLEQLRAWKADLFVVVAFRMLPEEVWAMPKLGTFNLHAALLPQYRGAAPINWAVINGERLTGVTTFMIDHNMDTGGIILRQEHRIGPKDTAGDVHDALMSLGAALVVDTVAGLLENNVETRVQRSFIQGDEVLRKAPKLTRELCHIDWNDATTAVYNLIRGLSPYPAAFTELVPAVPAEGEEVKPLALKVFRAEVMEGVSAAPGTVLSDGKSYLAVATADGALSLLEVQLSGKKRMAVHEFLLGFRDPQSYVCTPGTSRAEIAKSRL